MSRPKVLIVEDEFLIRMTLAEALTDDGFDVIEAETGDEALALFGQQESIDLLLTDVQLPGSLDGIALARAARARVPQLPVIYMTGRTDQLAGTGAAAPEVFIGKPYQLSDICAAARRLTGG
jgi:DNA-binding response OmpR family regulator